MENQKINVWFRGTPPFWDTSIEHVSQNNPIAGKRCRTPCTPAEGGTISSLKLIHHGSGRYALTPFSTLQPPFNPPQRTWEYQFWSILEITSNDSGWNSITSLQRLYITGSIGDPPTDIMYDFVSVFLTDSDWWRIDRCKFHNTIWLFNIAMENQP